MKLIKIKCKDALAWKDHSTRWSIVWHAPSKVFPKAFYNAGTWDEHHVETTLDIVGTQVGFYLDSLKKLKKGDEGVQARLVRALGDKEAKNFIDLLPKIIAEFNAAKKEIRKIMLDEGDIVE